MDFEAWADVSVGTGLPGDGAGVEISGIGVMLAVGGEIVFVSDSSTGLISDGVTTVTGAAGEAGGEIVIGKSKPCEVVSGYSGCGTGVIGSDPGPYDDR
jgi:hypothetical protein